MRTGAVGIARCFTFGGCFNRVLHDPDVAPRTELTREAYMTGTQQQTTINHFHEKLLKLEGRMNTDVGRAVARERTAVMVAFLEQFSIEWKGEDVQSVVARSRAMATSLLQNSLKQPQDEAQAVWRSNRLCSTPEHGQLSVMK
jgi:hypothetical protein